MRYIKQSVNSKGFDRFQVIEKTSAIFNGLPVYKAEKVYVDSLGQVSSRTGKFYNFVPMVEKADLGLPENFEFSATNGPVYGGFEKGTEIEEQIAIEEEKLMSSKATVKAVALSRVATRVGVEASTFASIHHAAVEQAKQTRATKMIQPVNLFGAQATIENIGG